MRGGRPSIISKEIPCVLPQRPRTKQRVLDCFRLARFTTRTLRVTNKLRYSSTCEPSRNLWQLERRNFLKEKGHSRSQKRYIRRPAPSASTRGPSRRGRPAAGRLDRRGPWGLAREGHARHPARRWQGPRRGVTRVADPRSNDYCTRQLPRPG